jgi:predicted PurR-regulated permease PerM
MSTQSDINRLQSEMAQMRLNESLKKKPKASKGYMIAFYSLLAVFIVSLIYGAYFISKTTEQMSLLNTHSNSLEKTVKVLESDLSSYRTSLDKANQTITDQNTKLSQKASTVYVPTTQGQSNYSQAQSQIDKVNNLPKTTTCNPNLAGGFTCY